MKGDHKLSAKVTVKLSTQFRKWAHLPNLPHIYQDINFKYGLSDEGLKQLDGLFETNKRQATEESEEVNAAKKAKKKWIGLDWKGAP